MSDLEIIESVVSRTHARRRRQSAWRGAWTGLVIGAVCWLLTLLAYKLLPIPSMTLTVGAILGLAPIAIGLLVGWSRGPSTLETAQWVDQRENLHERLSTAMEISRGETSQAWRDLVLNDAGRCAERIDPKRLLPLSLPRTSRWALLTLALGAGLGFAPEYRSPLYLKQKHETAVMRDTGRQLVELTRRNLQKRPPALEPTRNALDSVMELGEHLAKAKLTRNDALKDLASVTDQIKEQARELGKNPAIKSLERAARTPNKGGSPGFAELQKKIEALQTALGNQKAGSEELEKLKEDLERAREAAAGMPGGDSPEARSAREGLARSLADLSKQAADLGISLPSLEEAIAALATAETERMIRDLEIAETDLEKLHRTTRERPNRSGSINPQKNGLRSPVEVAFARVRQKNPWGGFPCHQTSRSLRRSRKASGTRSGTTDQGRLPGGGAIPGPGCPGAGEHHGTNGRCRSVDGFPGCPSKGPDVHRQRTELGIQPNSQTGQGRRRWGGRRHLGRRQPVARTE
jgi:hypothetical protein